ncbi:hypothetical protein ACOZ38_25630 [Sphaerisporangium viridialbum]|uniref:hypothetical protein n=1 Tax=Sphaerisporangium viridialbum TaxID=46189 RepID=UPI003C748A5B
MDRDILVATGNHEADNYLQIARTILPMQRALDLAVAAIEAGQPDQSVPYDGTYEAAIVVKEQAESDIEAAWDKAHPHFRTAQAVAPQAAEQADSEIEAMFNDYFARSTQPTGRHHR